MYGIPTSLFAVPRTCLFEDSQSGPGHVTATSGARSLSGFAGRAAPSRYDVKESTFPRDICIHMCHMMDARSESDQIAFPGLCGAAVAKLRTVLVLSHLPLRPRWPRARVPVGGQGVPRLARVPLSLSCTSGDTDSCYTVLLP